jgi:hypothetical protein
VPVTVVAVSVMLPVLDATPLAVLVSLVLVSIPVLVSLVLVSVTLICVNVSLPV